MQVIIAFSQDLERVFKLHLVPQLFHDFFTSSLVCHRIGGEETGGERDTRSSVFNFHDQ